MNTCYDSETSDFCHSGADYSCPLGFKRVTAGYEGKVLGDCEKCVAGEYCGKQDQMTASTNCEDGYMCLEYTEDQYSYPSQPGTKITANTGAQSETDCTDNEYCEGGNNAGTTCPAGYLSIEATTKVGAWSKASCTPVDAGKT